MIAGGGWRRPDDFLKLPSAKEGDKPAPLAVADLEKKKKKLSKQITETKGTDTADLPAVLNPFTNLSEEGLAKLKVRGVDVARLAKLKAVLLTGSYCGADCKTFINRDPDTVLIIGKGVVTHGGVYSLGPVLAVEDAHFMGDVIGADIVWFVDKSFPRQITTGLPVILAPTAERSQMYPGGDDIWHGDYGWRKPDDFLKPADQPKDKKD